MHQKISSEWRSQPSEEWSGNSRPYRSALLGVLACSGTIMILLHGVGLGNSWTSAGLIIIPIAILIAAGRYELTLWDYTLWDSVFILFVLWLGVSITINGLTSPKENALLVLTLATYPAARFSGVAGRAFFIVVAVVGLLGLACVGVELWRQWGDAHGKPLVFGLYDAAPAQVFLCFALLLMGAVASHMSRGWLFASYGLAAIALTILSASLVRFSFLALMGVMLCEAVLSPRTRTKALAAAILIAASWGAGYFARLESAEKVAIAISAEPDPTYLPPQYLPSTPCDGVNPYSSISIRKRLIADIVAALPHAGFFGHGLSSFRTMTCVDLPSHVTVAQAIIEFGWPAGLLLLLLLIGPFLRAARERSAEARFAVMAFLFAASISLVHGNLARDGLLFLFVGFLAKYSARLE